jgi:hypothetical protein
MAWPDRSAAMAPQPLDGATSNVYPYLKYLSGHSIGC